MAERLLSGRYRIVRHVARGGMAEVYLGHDELLDRTVAIKVLIPERASDTSFVERFRREAKAAAGLNHHNIVGVHDFGDDDGQYFMVMEYVEGSTLRDVIRSDGPMAPERATEIAAAIAAALAAAHAKGIIHRDVKPANVLIASATGTVKVADFGIARAADGAQDGLTMPGAVMGTANYLSPEQAQGLPVDARSDIYSLGMVVYEMLAGKAPFKGDSPVAVAYKQLHEVPPEPSALNPAVSPELDALVARALSKDPDDRPNSATEFRAELLAVGDDPVPVAAAPASDATLVDAPAGGGDPTQIASATSILPPQTRPPDSGPPRRPATSGSVYRRRRAILLGILAVVLGASLLALCTRGGGGGGGTATVPPVVGLSVVDATSELDKVGLKPDVVVEDRPGTPDQVLEQRPTAGAVVDKGSKVTLVVPRSVTTTSSFDDDTEPPTTTARATTTEAPTTTARPSTTARPATTVRRATTAAPTTTPSTSPPTTTPPTTDPPTPEP